LENVRSHPVAEEKKARTLHMYIDEIITDVYQIDVFPYSIFYVYFEQYLDIWATAVGSILLALCMDHTPPFLLPKLCKEIRDVIMKVRYSYLCAVL
jgi:hypothetical protein